MDRLTHSESIVIARPPAQVYELVSDVTRTGEWSPICQWCRWDEGSGARVGAMFTGHNEVAGRTWETRCEVVAADPGREFAWIVGQAYVRWGYALAAVDGGTQLTESWEFRPEGIAMFHEKYADAAQEQIDNRIAAAHNGIPRTLAAIKKIAESA
jgi:hypothetical protein